MTKDIVEVDEDELGLEKSVERLLRFSSEGLSHATAYDNAIMIGGYAGFFALWAGIASDIEPRWRLASAALMMVSIILFIGWQIISMLVRHAGTQKYASATKLLPDWAAFLEKWDEIDKERYRTQIRTMRYWPWVFVPSLATGTLGAVILTVAAALRIFQ